MPSGRSCVIIIPVYKKFELLEKFEAKSFDNIVTTLKNWPIALVAPRGLDGQPYISRAGFLGKELLVERFEERFFEGIAGYNQLVLNAAFYERFGNYDYLLIAQTDSWIFSDDLSKWCAKGYDYVGAPWVNDSNLKKVINNRHKWVFQLSMQLQKALGFKKDWMVGNGGLSLRKIDSSIQVLSKFKKHLTKFHANEDLFFCVFIPLIYPFFRIPDSSEAMAFSFEMNPELFYELNGRRLPFGCHAWQKYNYDFWKKWIPDALS